VAARVSCEFNPTPPMSHGGLVTLASQRGRQSRHAGHDHRLEQSYRSGGPASKATKARQARHDPQSTDHHHAQDRHIANTSSQDPRQRPPVPSGLAAHSHHDSGGARHSGTPAASPRKIRNANRSQSTRDSQDRSDGQAPGYPYPAASRCRGTYCRRNISTKSSAAPISIVSAITAITFRSSEMSRTWTTHRP